MAVPLGIGDDIRAMDAGGVPRAEIARRLRASRSAAAKYADMEDMPPAAPVAGGEAPRRSRATRGGRGMSVKGLV